MKKLIFIAFFLTFLAESTASPIIQDFSINPTELWIGEAPEISLKCSDDNNTITSVYSNITSSYMTFPTLTLNLIGGKYVLSQGAIKLYLDDDTKGTFNVDVFCVNNKSEISTTSGTFYISEILMDINSIKSNPSYIGDIVEINLDIEKDGSPIKSYDIDFEILLDDQVSGFAQTQPYYYEGKGWVLKFQSPDSQGEYDLEIIADYKGKVVTYETKLTVQDPIKFEIIYPENKTEIKEEENITIRLKAYEEDEKIELAKDYITIEIDSAEVNSNLYSVSHKTTYDEITFKPSSFSSGIHELEISFDYEHFSTEETRKLFYIVPIYGEVLNFDDDPIHTEFTFSSDYITKTIKTESNGSYYGFICLDQYDLEMEFPHSYIELSNADIEEDDLDNLIKYNYYGSLDMSGIRSGGTFFYDISPSFSSGSITMHYSSKDITDKENMNVYRCDDWDADEKLCDDLWEEVDFEIDEIDNEVEVDASDYGAYVIGNEKSLDPTFSLDKKEYYLGEIITIDGITRDDVHEAVGSANVNLEIRGTGISTSVKSSSSGVVSAKLTAPDKAGSYILLIEVEKEPYEMSTNTLEVTVLRKNDVSLIIPQTIRVEQGKNSSAEFSIINIGQGDLSNIILSIDGIPKEYYEFKDTISSLKIGEEERIEISFFIPENAAEGTFGGKFIAKYEGVTKEETFGFTISPKSVGQETEENSTSSTKTGRFVLPEISIPDLQFLYMIPIVLASFVVTFLLKRSKKKKSSGEHNELSKMFSEIKVKIRKKKELSDMTDSGSENKS